MLCIGCKLLQSIQIYNLQITKLEHFADAAIYVDVTHYFAEK